MTSGVTGGVPLTRRRIPVPLPGPWFWAIAVLYALLGLAGHDPWKPDDAIGFGIAWSMAQGGLADWLIPNVAGQMVTDEGPLAFWLAALFIKLFGAAAVSTGGAVAVSAGSAMGIPSGGLLQAHDAARLASAVWSLTAIYAAYRAARATFGEAEGRLTVLALLACPGLLARTHEIAAEPTFIAACALLLWALAAAPARAHHARGAISMACAIGGALALAALARGLPAALTLCVALILLSAWDAAWRTPRLLAVQAGAVALALFLFSIWTRSTVALVEGDGPAFAHFYGRAMAAQFGLPSLDEARSAAKTLAWFVFPLWPVVLWWLLRPRKTFLGEPEPRRLHLPALALCAATLTALAWTRTLSEAALLPLLPGCAVLVTPAISRLAKGMAASIDWFGRITFTLCAALIWLGYCALQLGWPPRIAANFARLEPGFEATFAPVSFLIALAATLAWLIASARSERTVLRAITHWAYGITLVWLLLMTLWLPWIDYGKSYRSVAIGLRSALGADLGASAKTVPAAGSGAGNAPAGKGPVGKTSAADGNGAAAAAKPGASNQSTRPCLEVRQLGLAERASLAYFLGMPFGPQCGWLLVQAREDDARTAPAGTRLVWEGNRPGERVERFRLYKKT